MFTWAHVGAGRASWSKSHNDVVQALLEKARNGTRVILIPGNHDDVMRNYFGLHFGGIELKPNDTFVSASGRRYLVTHGDGHC